MGSFMHMLMISLCLGAGVGVIIPIANSLPSEFFFGKERQRQLGICAAIADAAQVFCLFMTGVLCSNFGWKAPFFVYLIAVIPLFFSFLIIRAHTENNIIPSNHGTYIYNIELDKF